MLCQCACVDIMCFFLCKIMFQILNSCIDTLTKIYEIYPLTVKMGAVIVVALVGLVCPIYFEKLATMYFRSTATDLLDVSRPRKTTTIMYVSIQPGSYRLIKFSIT